MQTVLLVVLVLVVLALIAVILLQKSEGGALGIGGGGGGGFMSARGAADALTKTTTILAAGFFVTAIALGVLSKQENRTDDIVDRATQIDATGVPSDSENQPSSADTLLDDLQGQGNTTAPTGVPTTE